MVQRGEGRALAAGGDIGGPEIMHHRDAGDAGEQGGIADLPCAVLLGLVQNGLAVEADNVRPLPQQADGQSMVAGEALFHLGQEWVVRGDAGGEVEQAAQIGPKIILETQSGAGAELGDALAIGEEPGGVDTVERGAGHQADGANRPGHGFGAHG